MPATTVTFTLDNRPVTVRSGATILDAAVLAGVTIPTLCHDQGLHPYGACRICLVEVQGPPRRLLPACTTPAADGMNVQTMSPAVVQARKDILELLLINHPLDCPVCDKAGECRLQDLVHEYGLGPALFAETRRTTPPDHASPLIERNQNRCLFCGKCVRTCRERCGVGALTFSMRGGHSQVGPAFGDPLACEFCGSCVEICPVGALTTRQFKYKARSWNLEQTRSTCIYCGNGCPIAVETDRGKLVRVRSGGDGYICAKGRFGWDAVQHESRLLIPKVRVNGKLVDCTWEEALSVVATHLKVIRQRHGAAGIGGLGSVRTTNEENYLFQKFLRNVVGTNNVDLLGRLKFPFGLNAAYFAEEIATLKEHDVIILLEPDTGEINPRTGVEIVHAVNRAGSKLIAVGTKRTKFDSLASLSIVDEAGPALAGLIAALAGGKRAVSDRTKRVIEMLLPAKSVALVLPERCSAETFAAIRDLSGLLRSAAFYPVLMRGNLQGAMDLGVMPDYRPGYRSVDAAGLNAVGMLRSEGSSISALYIMGDDPVGSDPNLALPLKALEFLVVQDIFLTETAKLAQVVLPAAAFTEKSGTITSLERRLRRIAKVSEPVGESREDWQILQALAQRWGNEWNYAKADDILQEIRTTVPLYTGLAVDSRWQREQSPLAGTIADLSLRSPDVMPEEVITAGRLLFSSGTMTTRSRELANIEGPRVPSS